MSRRSRHVRPEPPRDRLFWQMAVVCGVVVVTVTCVMIGAVVLTMRCTCSSG